MRSLAVVLILWPGLLFAQTYPDYTSTTVNDFADLLPPEAEARVAAQLSRLEMETGVEMALVTLPDLSVSGPLTLEMYATELFNRWGVGKTDRNDGVLLLVARDDRLLRIELGAAYGQGWNGAARGIMDEVILPPYRDNHEVEAIEAGLLSLETDLVRPFLAGNPPPYPNDGSTSLWAFLGILGGLLGLGGVIIGYNHIQLAREPCPNCGKTGLRREKITFANATRYTTGSGERRTSCPSCGHVTIVPLFLPMLTDSGDSSSGGSGGSFGGGSSGGGGASGHG